MRRWKQKIVMGNVHSHRCENCFERDLLVLFLRGVNHSVTR